LGFHGLLRVIFVFLLYFYQRSLAIASYVSEFQNRRQEIFFYVGVWGSFGLGVRVMKVTHFKGCRSSLLKICNQTSRSGAQKAVCSKKLSVKVLGLKSPISQETELFEEL
jgi:hypothetical protein